jgi:hypothetical protein
MQVQRRDRVEVSRTAWGQSRRFWISPAVLLILSLTCSFPAFAQKKTHTTTDDVRNHTDAPALLWRQPADLTSQNLFYGPGGKQDEPHGKFTFEKEDLAGTNPKFFVRDEDGVKWKAKLGVEARPETVASRVIWSVGYFASEDYFLPELKVENMAHLSRGQEQVSADGLVRNARLKRHLKGEKEMGSWKWRHNPFSGTRELDGLRVMMALINNWDLKDINNSVYEDKSSQGSERISMVSDLGASFGSTGPGWSMSRSKGNFRLYEHSKFISKITTTYIDFNVPTRPTFIWCLYPPSFIGRMRLRWIGKHIPRDHVRWIAALLAQLSTDQIRDSFRAGGYSPEEVERYTQVVMRRVHELNKL